MMRLDEKCPECGIFPGQLHHPDCLNRDRTPGGTNVPPQALKDDKTEEIQEDKNELHSVTPRV